MAKSKNGGTRSYIRGRIGSDVYSIGKDGKGQTQQVVRSLAEQVANPRTQSQMFNRMIMSTVMQAVSGLSPIIDHSFDGVAKGQPSISEFIRRNYVLVKADAVANPAASNAFGLNKYQEKGVKAGAYVISFGTMVLPSGVAKMGTGFMITVAGTNPTVGDLKAQLGLNAEGFLTFVRINGNGDVEFFRAHLNPALADSTALSADIEDTLFVFEGNVTPVASYSGGAFDAAITAGTGKYTYGLIVSDKIDGVWKHNQCVLSGNTGIDFNADAALPTYPVGAEQFLNGGEI